MASKSICIRTDEEVKKDAEVLFDSMGMSLSTAVNVFLKQAIRVNGMPFELKGYTPNDTTRAAIKESDEKVLSGKSKGYSDIDSLRSALEL